MSVLVLDYLKRRLSISGRVKRELTVMSTMTIVSFVRHKLELQMEHKLRYPCGETHLDERIKKKEILYTLHDVVMWRQC